MTRQARLWVDKLTWRGLGEAHIKRVNVAMWEILLEILTIWINAESTRETTFVNEAW
jgi:hypothetical protein